MRKILTAHLRGCLCVLLAAACLTCTMAETRGQEPAAQPAAAEQAAPGELDFEIDTSEFENFGDEDFVVEEPLDAQTDTLVTVAKVLIAVVVIGGVVWLVRRLVRSTYNRNQTPD